MPAERLLPNTDIESVTQRSGSYLNQDVPLNTAFTPLLTNSSQTLLFQLPNTLVNLEGATITYNWSVNAGAAFFNAYEDQLGMEAFSSITLSSSTGVNFVQITNPSLYGKVMPKLDQPHKTFLTNDDTTGFHPPLAGAVNALPIAITPPAGNCYNLPAAATYAAVSYPQPKYVRSSATAGLMNVSRTIPLGQMTGTMFALKHDQFFNTVMNITLATAPLSNFGFTTTAAYTGTSGSYAGFAANTFGVTLSNVVLNLPIQQDPVIIKGFIDMTMRGSLKYQIPFLTQVSTSLSAGQSSANVNISSANGMKVKRLINIAVAQASTNPTEIANYDGSKITWFGTSLNGNQLQKRTQNNCKVPCTALMGVALDDYRENKRFLSDSCLSDYSSYATNWFHCDSFTQRSTNPLLSSDQIDEGYSMGLGNTTYQFTCNATTALILWTFIESIKHVEIGPSGPQLSN